MISYNIFPSLFLVLQCKFFPLWLRHLTSATKVRYLRSSAFYRAPWKLAEPWSLICSELQLPSELVPIFSKARNAAVVSLLTCWGFMASTTLRMWAASPDIQPSTPSSNSHWPALVSPMSWSPFGLTRDKTRPNSLNLKWTLGTRAGALYSSVFQPFLHHGPLYAIKKFGEHQTKFYNHNYDV